MPARMGGADIDIVQDEVIRDAVPARMLGNLVAAAGSLGWQHPAGLVVSARRKDGRTPIGVEAALRQASFDQSWAAIGDAPRRRHDHLGVEHLHKGRDARDLGRVETVLACATLIRDGGYDAIDVEVDRWSCSAPACVQDAVSVPCSSPALAAARLQRDAVVVQHTLDPVDRR